MKKKVIVVLSGGVAGNAIEGWRSPGFKESFVVGVSGSYIRVLAGYYLWRSSPDLLIIASGGRPEGYEFLPKGISISTILKKELVDLGVPNKSIIEESYSKTTISQLLGLVSFMNHNQVDRFHIISNRYHLPRIKAMIENCPFLDNLEKVSEIVSAEDIMEPHSSYQMKSEIKDFYSSQEGLAIIESEKRGVEQIKTGTYAYRF